MSLSKFYVGVAAVSVASLALTACTAQPSYPAAAAAASTAAVSIDPTATGPLTKADFIIQANSVCAATDKKISSLPVAADNQDYTSLIADFSQTIPIFESHFTLVQSLIARSSDRNELTTKWLNVEKGDFTASKPIIESLVQALKAKNSDAIKAADKKLKAAPDHTDELIRFFNDYGLKACTSMESNSDH